MTRECTVAGVRWNVVELGPIQSPAGLVWRLAFTPFAGGATVTRTVDRSLDEFHAGELGELLERGA